MNLDQLISKIPKPLLVFGVLAVALIVIWVNNPLKDECEVRTDIFLKEMRGIITSVRVKKAKTQFAQLTFWKDKCKEGNTAGTCDDYFKGLSKLTTALSAFPDKCQSKFAEENEFFGKTIYEALQIMSLAAWGEKPPVSAAERFGWLSEREIKTFCKLKSTLMLLIPEEELEGLKEKIYSQYPDEWSEKIPVDLRIPEDRPKAYKTTLNPTAPLDKNKVYERSLFSVRCDLYQ